MIEGLLKNSKLIEGMIGSLVRLIPPAQWQLIAGELGVVAKIATEFKAQLDRIEAQLNLIAAAQQQCREDIDFHETLLRNSEGTGPAFAEREMYCGPRRVTLPDGILPGIMESEKFNER